MSQTSSSSRWLAALGAGALALAVLVAWPLWAGALVQQERPDDPEMAAMMEAYAKAAAPGEHHEHLKPLVGNWDASVRFQTPQGEVTSDGRSENRMEMGGRFLFQRYSGEMMGQEFKGLSIVGYDNTSGQYQSIWLDDMSTALYFSEGDCDEDGKTFTFTGNAADPMTGDTKKYKHVIEIKDDDEHVFKMYEDDADEPSVVITYTRR